MTNGLWQGCLDCKTKCCVYDIAFPLFVTPKERETNKAINSKIPCVFFNDCKLCEIHDSRPFDCRFFPFDLMKINKKFFWIIWDTDCQITKNRCDGFEKYLKAVNYEIPFPRQLLTKLIKYKRHQYGVFYKQLSIYSYDFAAIRKTQSCCHTTLPTI
jgi:Fe-S-cluster containining protein